MCKAKLSDTLTLYNENVLVTTNPQPASKARRIIAPDVVGGAEARPNGFSNFKPQISTLISISSIGE